MYQLIFGQFGPHNCEEIVICRTLAHFHRLPSLADLAARPDQPEKADDENALTSDILQFLRNYEVQTDRKSADTRPALNITRRSGLAHPGNPPLSRF